MTIEKVIQTILSPARSLTEAEAFLNHYAHNLWHNFNEYRMAEIQELDKNSPWVLQLQAATEEKNYKVTQQVPVLLEKYQRRLKNLAIYWHDEDVTLRLGLCISIAETGESFTIEGNPTLESFRVDGKIAPSTFRLHAEYGFENPAIAPEEMCLSKDFEFVITQNPQKLWRNVAVDWKSMPEPRYMSPDAEKERVQPGGVSQKCIVAASKRGRSHAHEGKPRDDNFIVKYLPETEWYVLAVADGAGSAPYSRKGSRLACDVSVQSCMESLNDTIELEKAIELYANGSPEEDRQLALKAVGDKLYQILAIAALKAQKAIFAEATSQGNPSKQYATTLLLSICKKLNCGWAIASFWVGDGAIGLYTKEQGGSNVKILGTPDEGEFGGQTRFLTMPEIFSDSTSLYQRIGFRLVDDFTALFLMSDGVSDPKFETDDNLKNPVKWDELWQDLLSHDVNLENDSVDIAEQLLNWLDFWSKGNHDDRTVAILYGGEEAERSSSFSMQYNVEIEESKNEDVVSSENVDVKSEAPSVEIEESVNMAEQISDTMEDSSRKFEEELENVGECHLPNSENTTSLSESSSSEDCDKEPYPIENLQNNA